jgi:NAD(P)-dependent dehydrogenase (short-subunit alcohol dehydrogenase family)
MRGLKGKNVLVTGGASGIGQATAARLLEEGWAVCVLDRSAEALELASCVRGNAISPGYVLTAMQRAEYTDAMLEALNRKIPLGRHATPEENAALFAFLVFEDAAFATGQVYVMDGAETTGGLCSQWARE